MPPTGWPRSGSRRAVSPRADLPGANAAVAELPRADGARPDVRRARGALRHRAAARSPTQVGDDAEALLVARPRAPAGPGARPGGGAGRPPGRPRRGAVSPSRRAGPASGGEDERITFLTHLVAALSHVRVVAGRAALGVDLHLWVRELTRIDRVASSAARYLWSDDGELTDLGRRRAPSEQRAFPAIYCRHCGRSGWGVGLAAVGSNLDTDDTAIRRNHAAHEGRFRALIYAPLEADHAPAAGAVGGRAEDGDCDRRGAALVLDPAADAAAAGARRRRPGLPRRLGAARAHPGRPRRRRRLQGRHLPVVPAEGRHPLPRQRDRHPAVGDAVDACSATRPSTRGRRRRSSSPTACRTPRTGPASWRAARTR